MRIVLNGQPREVDPTCSLAQLVGELDLALAGAALVLNGEVIEHAALVRTVLRDGDAVEVVRLVGGG
ncbi:MAG: sulfur carrier protein ThiS [Deltaproteobacteria bacterium]|nr:sulfur carrier protein ThiS [Deltaproteobacteria bacterium]